MTRSIWKGPFVDGYLLDAVEAVKESGKNKPIKTNSRRSTILPHFVGMTFNVYNGKKYIAVNIDEDKVGHKLGEFSPTRTFYGHGANKKTKKK
jgi:small subunit ribosomal protein S19